MIYIIAVISTIVFLGLIIAKFAYYVLIPNIIVWISMAIAFLFSTLAIADFVSEFISNLIKGQKK